MTGVEEWIRSGLVEEGTALLGRPADWTNARPLSCELIDGRIHLDRAGNSVRLTRGVLDAFISLQDATDGEIVDFVRRWGGLSLCRCGVRPFQHRAVDGCEGGWSPGSAWPRDDDHEIVEPLTAWKLYIDRAAAIVGLGALTASTPEDESLHGPAWDALIDDLLRNPSGSELLPDWRCQRYEHGQPCDHGVPAPDAHRLCGLDRHWRCPDCGQPRCWRPSGLGVFEIGEVVDEWMALAGVRLRFGWPYDPPTIRLVDQSEGLLGFIATQIALVLSTPHGLALCSSCGRPYSPSRKPATGRAHYCPACGTRAKNRLAKQRQRARRGEPKGEPTVEGC